jgi:hypothetical protein
MTLSKARMLTKVDIKKVFSRVCFWFLTDCKAIMQKLTLWLNFDAVIAIKLYTKVFLHGCKAIFH